MRRASVVAVVSAAAIMLAAAGRWEEATDMSRLLPKIDHLVYATNDLSATVQEFDRRLGVRATPGGQHPGRGTRNFLLSLGPGTYLEIIGPDPDQPAPGFPRAFGIDTLHEARLVTWAAQDSDLSRIVKEAASRGIALGPLSEGSRRRPDGVLLKWQFTSPQTVVADGIVPFFINWGTTEHPSRTAAQGAKLASLRAEHPDAGRVQKMLEQLGLPLRVTQGQQPALVATVEGPGGRVELK